MTEKTVSKKKKKPSKAELTDAISKRTNDAEIIKIAVDIAHGGEDIDTAIRAATEEVQELKRAVPSKEQEKRNKGRKRLLCRIKKGPAKGRETVYWADIAERFEARGEVEIIKEYK